MKKYAVRYALRDSGRNIVRHPLVLFASVTTVTLMLLLMSFYVSFMLNAQHLVEVAGQQPPIEIRLSLGVDERQLEELVFQLTEDPEVLDWHSYTPAENLEKFKRDMGKDELFDEEGLVNILPHTVSVRLVDPALGAAFRERTMQLPGVHDVVMERQLMEALQQITRTVTRVGVIVFVVLAVISTFVVANMVRVSILSRATEIGIMKYVGATNLYVRVPFVIEGLFVGYLSSHAATLILGLFYNQLNRASTASSSSIFGNLSREFSLLPTSQIVLLVLLLNIITGLALCVVASWISVRRHIKV